MFYRLPQTLALLFGIRIVDVSLAEIKTCAEPKPDCIAAIDAMSDDVVGYKNVTETRVHWLEIEV